MFCGISRTLVGGGGLTLLQRCSWCILQPQPTGKTRAGVSNMQPGNCFSMTRRRKIFETNIFLKLCNFFHCLWPWLSFDWLVGWILQHVNLWVILCWRHCFCFIRYLSYMFVTCAVIWLLFQAILLLVIEYLI